MEDSIWFGRVITQITELLDEKREAEDWTALEGLGGLLRILEAQKSGNQEMQTALAELPNEVLGAVQTIMSVARGQGLDGAAPEVESEDAKRMRRIREVLGSGLDDAQEIAAKLSDEGTPTTVRQVAAVKAVITRKKDRKR